MPTRRMLLIPLVGRAALLTVTNSAAPAAPLRPAFLTSDTFIHRIDPPLACNSQHDEDLAV